MNADLISSSSDIDRIVQLAAASSAELITFTPTIALPDGVTIHSLEKYSSAPVRMRQNFHTERPSDFIAYVSDNKSDSTSIYVAADGARTKAILDHGTVDFPEFGEHTALLNLKKTRAFIALETLCSKSRNQQDLIDYLEDWAKDGTAECLRDGEKVNTALAIVAVRKVEIKASAQSTHAQGDFNVATSSVASLDVTGATERMPTHIVLKSPIYNVTAERDIVCRIGITGDEGKPQIRLRIMQIEMHEEAVAREIESLMRTELETCRVFVGEANR